MKQAVRLEWVGVCVGSRLYGSGIVWVRVSDPDRPREARQALVGNLNSWIKSAELGLPG